MAESGIPPWDQKEVLVEQKSWMAICSGTLTRNELMICYDSLWLTNPGGAVGL